MQSKEFQEAWISFQTSEKVVNKNRKYLCFKGPVDYLRSWIWQHNGGIYWSCKKEFGKMFLLLLVLCGAI